MRQVILIAAAALLAMPAEAQRLRLENEPPAPVILPPTPRTAPPPIGSCAKDAFGNTTKATADFVENINTASKALNAKAWYRAIGAAALARTHAANGIQLSAALQIEVAGYHGIGNTTALKEKLLAALEDPCLPEATRRNYLNVLDGLEEEGADPQPQ